MAIGQQNRTIAVSILQIGFSHNTECANMDGFPWPGHIYVTRQMLTASRGEPEDASMHVPTQVINEHVIPLELFGHVGILRAT